MFEIRILCDPDDTDRVTAALTDTFTTGPGRHYPARDGRRRLYFTAQHKPARWPAPEDAYREAPSILSEIEWIARTARDLIQADSTTGPAHERDYHLRKAALLDRIDLTDPRTDTGTTADQAARHLMNTDHATAICDPRHYVRQQYALHHAHPAGD